MKISVVIPMYNAEKYIERCLQSILKTKEDIEIIVVNDGSTDRSLEIVNSFSDKRLKVFTKQNEGTFKTWIYGVKHASGDYIMFADADDYVDDGLYSDMTELLNKYKGVDMIQFGLKLINGNISKERPITPLKDGYYDKSGLEQLKANMELTPKYIVPDFSVTKPTKVLRKEPFVKYLDNLKLTFSPSIVEDIVTIIPYVHTIKSLYVTHKVYYNYVNIPNSLSKCHNEDKLRGRFEEIKGLLHLCISRKDKFGFLPEELDNMKYKWCLYFLSSCIIHKCYKLANEAYDYFNIKDVLQKFNYISNLRKFLYMHKMFRTYHFLYSLKHLFKKN